MLRKLNISWNYFRVNYSTTAPVRIDVQGNYYIRESLIMKKAFLALPLMFSTGSSFAAGIDCLSEFDEPCIEQTVGTPRAATHEVQGHGTMPKGAVMDHCLTAYDEPCLEQTLNKERQE